MTSEFSRELCRRIAIEKYSQMEMDRLEKKASLMKADKFDNGAKALDEKQRKENERYYQNIFEN